MSPDVIEGTFNNEENLIRLLDPSKFREGHLYIGYFNLDSTSNTIKLILTVYTKEQVYSDCAHDFTGARGGNTNGAKRILESCKDIFFNDSDFNNGKLKMQELNRNLNTTYRNLLNDNNPILNSSLGSDAVIEKFIETLSPERFRNVSPIKYNIIDSKDTAAIRKMIRNDAITALICLLYTSPSPRDS